MSDNFSYKRKLYYIYLMLLLLFLFLPVKGQEVSSMEYCDKIIQSARLEFHNKNYPKALELFTEAKILAENNGWNKQLFLAVNGLGVIYSEILNYAEALDYFLEAYKISLKGGDDHNERSALINIGIMYYKEGNSEKAIDYLKKVYGDATAANDTPLIGVSATNLAILYNKTGKVEEAVEYLKTGLKLLENDDRGLPHVKVAEVENVFLSGQPEKAKKMATALMKEIQGVRNREHRISIYLLLSKIYDREGNLSKAIENINIALTENPDMVNKIEIFNHLSKIYSEWGNYDKALAYKDSIVVAKDSLNKVTNLLHFENNRIKFEMANYQKDIEYNQQLRTRERVFFFLVLALAVILIWAIYNSLTKEKQKKILAEWNQKVVTLELEQEKNSNLLLEKQLQEKETLALLEQNRFDMEQDALKSEIEAKNRELITKAMYLSSKNELIDEIYNSLSDLPDVTKKHDLLKHVQSLRNQVKNESEWGSFLLYFEEVNQDFINALKEKHPNLTPNDIRFLSYIYMGLNTKEISSLLNITPDSCKKKKMRICQKLKLPGGAPSLFSYLSNI